MMKNKGRDINSRLLVHSCNIYRKQRTRNKAQGFITDFELKYEGVSYRLSSVSGSDAREIEHEKKQYKIDAKAFFEADTDIQEEDYIEDAETGEKYDVTRILQPSKRSSHIEVYLTSRG